MPKVGVLLVHGLTGVPSEMRPVEKYLQKMGFDVESPTLAGHGTNNDEMLRATWKQWLESAQEGFDRLSERVDQIVVCGLSMGASICSVLATRNEKAIALVMLSPTLMYDSPELDAKPHLRIFKSQLLRDCLHVLLSILPVIGRFIYWTETPPYGLKDERLQRQITKAIEAAKRGEDTKFGLFRTYWISMYQMNYITDAFKNTAAAMKLPALLVSSLEDTLVSIDNAARTYARLGTHNKSMVMLTGCDHVITLDLKRNYVARLVGEFMEALTNVPAPPVEQSVELSLEVHNRLNPLSNLDWPQLVPGAPSLAALAEHLSREGIHESQCHTIAVRADNKPLFMLPLVIDAVKRTALVGICERNWGTAPAAGGGRQVLEQAWQQCQRVKDALFKAYGVQSAQFLQPQQANEGALV